MHDVANTFFCLTVSTASQDRQGYACIQVLLILGTAAPSAKVVADPPQQPFGHTTPLMFLLILALSLLLQASQVINPESPKLAVPASPALLVCCIFALMCLHCSTDPLVCLQQVCPKGRRRTRPWPCSPTVSRGNTRPGRRQGGAEGGGGVILHCRLPSLPSRLPRCACRSLCLSFQYSVRLLAVATFSMLSR